jgi:hypothetical protein
MLYFPICWLLGILLYILSFIKFKKNEVKYKMYTVSYEVNKIPRLKVIKLIIKSSNDKIKIKDFRYMLLLIYLSYILFFLPLIIFFVLGMLQPFLHS